MGKNADPRVAIVVEIMLRTRAERAKRMIIVRDMRRKDGRVSMSEEAQQIIDALDDYDAKQFEDVISKGMFS